MARNFIMRHTFHSIPIAAPTITITPPADIAAPAEATNRSRDSLENTQITGASATYNDDEDSEVSFRLSDHVDPT